MKTIYVASDHDAAETALVLESLRQSGSDLEVTDNPNAATIFVAIVRKFSVAVAEQVRVRRESGMPMVILLPESVTSERIPSEQWWRKYVSCLIAAALYRDVRELPLRVVDEVRRSLAGPGYFSLPT